MTVIYICGNIGCYSFSIYIIASLEGVDPMKNFWCKLLFLFHKLDRFNAVGKITVL